MFEFLQTSLKDNGRNKPFTGAEGEEPLILAFARSQPHRVVFVGGTDQPSFESIVGSAGCTMLNKLVQSFELTQPLFACEGVVEVCAQSKSGHRLGLEVGEGDMQIQP